MNPDASPPLAEPPASAVERLVRSRRQLSAALGVDLPPEPAGQRAPRRWRALVRWWRRHPAHDAAAAVLRAGDALIGPTVRRHPWTAVLAAGAVGALLVWARPWRSGWVRAGVATAGAQLRHQAWREVPWNALFDALLTPWRPVAERPADAHAPSV